MAKEKSEQAQLYHVGLKPGGLHACDVQGVHLCVSQLAYSGPADSRGQVVYGGLVRMDDDRRKKFLEAVEKRFIEWTGNAAEEETRDSIVGVGPKGAHTRCSLIVEGSAGFNPGDIIDPLRDWVYLYPIMSKDQQLHGPKPTISELASGAPTEQLEIEAAALKDAYERKQRELKALTDEAIKTKESRGKKEGAVRA